MSTFTFNIYLVEDIDGDGNPDYVLQDEGRIILETKSISVDSSYRYIGGQIGRRATPALTFDIRKGPNDEWYLFYNRGTFAGKYPTQAAAVGILYGIYTSFDGLDDGFAQWIADSLEKGSYIEPDENVLTLSEDGSNVTTVLGDIDFESLVNGQTFPLGVYLGYQTQDPGSSTWSTPLISDATVTITAADNGNTESATTNSGAWTALSEGSSIRPCVIGFDAPSVVLLSGASRTKPYEPALTDVSLAPSGVTLNGGSVQFTASALADVSQPSRPLPSDLVYTYTITATSGDITTVTSANPSTGRFYTLTYDYANNIDRTDDILRIEVEASSVSLGVTVSETTSATLEYPTSPVIPVIDFAVEVSGTDGLPATDVEINGSAYAVITDSSTGGIPSFTYEWYQSVPTLTGITLTNVDGA